MFLIWHLTLIVGTGLMCGGASLDAQSRPPDVPRAAVAGSVVTPDVLPEPLMHACDSTEDPRTGWTLTEARIVPVRFELPPRFVETPVVSQYGSRQQSWVREPFWEYITLRVDSIVPQAAVTLGLGQMQVMAPGNPDSAIAQYERQAAEPPDFTRNGIGTSCILELRDRSVWLRSGYSPHHRPGLYVVSVQWRVRRGVWAELFGASRTLIGQRALVTMFHHLRLGPA